MENKKTENFGLLNFLKILSGQYEHIEDSLEQSETVSGAAKPEYGADGLTGNTDSKVFNKAVNGNAAYGMNNKGLTGADGGNAAYGTNGTEGNILAAVIERHNKISNRLKNKK